MCVKTALYLELLFVLQTTAADLFRRFCGQRPIQRKYINRLSGMDCRNPYAMDGITIFPHSI